MKTAISLPDATFARLSRQATAQGISRSALVVRALEDYLEGLESTAVTDAIDEVVARVGQDESGADAAVAGRRRLSEQGDDW